MRDRAWRNGEPFASDGEMTSQTNAREDNLRRIRLESK
jgi:hypothetical protein